MNPPKRVGAERIGLLTLTLHINYGGILQIAALYSFLSDQGREVTLFRTGPNRPAWHRLIAAALRNIPFQNIGGLRARHLAWSTHTPFIERYLPRKTAVLRTNAQLSQEVARLNLDAFIVGSDQVWRRKFAFGSDFLNYFLDFVRDDTRKISYAASFGNDHWQEQDLTDNVKSLLARFHAITLREETGRQIVAETFGRDDSTLVLDPTLLMSADFYEAMLETAVLPAAPTLMKYVLDPVPELEMMEKSAMEILGKNSCSTGIYLEGQDRQASIPQWLRAFRDADFVVTDSFHGMAFSIIFRKQFVALVNKDRGADRFISLARQLGLEDRLIHIGKGQSFPEKQINYSEVEPKLERRRAESAAALLKALDV